MSESNINVAVKIRPLIKREIEKKIPACWKSTKNTLIDVTGANEFNFGNCPPLLLFFLNPPPLTPSLPPQI